MFIIQVNEALHYTHDYILDCSYVLILSLLREHSFMVNDRNRKMYGEDDEKTSGTSDTSGEWVEMVDFSTGEKKRYRKAKNI